MTNIALGTQIGSPGTLASALANWLPTDHSNLGSWHVAGVGYNQNGSGELQQWDDQSGNDYHLIQNLDARKPLVNTDTLNGVQVVDCITRAANPLMNLTGIVTGPYDPLPSIQNRRGAFFAVVRTVTPVNSGGLFGLRNTLGGDVITGIWASNRHYWPTATNGYHLVNPTTMTTGQWHIMAANWTNDNQHYYVDGTLDLSSGAAGDGTTYPFDAFTIGTRAANGTTANGQYAEIITTSEPLNTADFDRFHGYLANKWNI